MDESGLQLFGDQLSASLEAVRRVLHNERYLSVWYKQKNLPNPLKRKPQVLEHVDHKYDDKFALVALMTNMTLASLLNCLEMLGLDGTNLETACSWSQRHSVTLELRCEEKYLYWFCWMFGCLVCFCLFGV